MNIAIVFGGKSIEHDVSIVTAKQIHNMCKEVYSPLLIYVDKQGKLNLYKNNNFNFEDFKHSRTNFVPVMLKDGYLFRQTLFGYNKLTKIDCAIMCTHGGDGENGVLASYFITSGVPVTAGNSLALGVSMNKWLTKQFLRANKISNVKGLFANKQSNIDDLDKQIVSKFGYPVIVKANGGGSSIGIKTAKSKDELKEALEIALQFDNSAVIEQELTNFTEYNCAVFGDKEEVMISNIDEPVKKDEILSFTDKYLSGSPAKKVGKGSMKNQQRIYPILPQNLDNKIKTISKQIFKRLGFYGVVRIDYIYVPKTKKLFVNEINAIPGSLASYYFINDKFSVNMFIDKLVNIGIKNFKENKEINTNYITKLF